MASSRSIKRKYHALTSGRFSRGGERDVVYGARSMERLNSLEVDKTPQLIFSTGRGSFVRQKQEELLRSASLTASQPQLNSLSTCSSTFRAYDNLPNTSTISTTSSNNTDSNNNVNVAAHNGLRRSSSQKLPRIPSWTLRDIDFLRLRRRSDVITIGVEGEEKGRADRERKTEKMGGEDSRRSSSSSSSMSHAGKDFPRRRVSEDYEDAVMRRKTSNDKSSRRQTSEHSSSDRAGLLRPWSLHSERNSPRSSSWRENLSAKNAGLSSSSSSTSGSTPRPHSAVVDRDWASGGWRRSSAGVERSSSLRDVSHTSTFSDRSAARNRPTRRSFRSERTISLTNLSASTHGGDKDSTNTHSVGHHSGTAGDGPSRTDSEVQAATSVSHLCLEPSFPERTDSNSWSEPDLSVSTHPTPLSSLQAIVNYDGSGLEVVQSLPHSVSSRSVGEEHGRSSEMKTISAVTEKTQSRTKKHSASSESEEKGDSKGSVRTAKTKASYKDVTLNKGDSTDQVMTASVPCFPSPSDHFSSRSSSNISLSFSDESTLVSNDTPAKGSPAEFSDPDRKSDSPKSSMSADAVLSYLDNALESHTTGSESPHPPSGSFPLSIHQHQPAAPNTPENQKRSVSLAETTDSTSHSVAYQTVMNGFSGEPQNTDTSTGKVVFKDQEAAELLIQEKRKGGKAKRKPTPTKVTKYEGSVKTVRRQIKPGHVEELREMFKKQEEEHDKLVMRRRRRHPRNQDVGSTDDADDSGSGYTTTSSDNEYDLELAERLNSPDCLLSPVLCPPVPSSQWGEQQQGEEETNMSGTANTESTSLQNRESQVTEDFQVRNVSDIVSSEAGEQYDKTSSGEESKAIESESVSLSDEADSPPVSPAAELNYVSAAPPQPSFPSADVEPHASHAADSELYTGTTTLWFSHTAASGTSFSTSRNEEAIDNEGMNDADTPGISFETTGRVDLAQLQADESRIFQSDVVTTNSEERSWSSSPPQTSGNKRSVLHRETPASRQILRVMDDCHTSLPTSSPPPVITAGREEGKLVMSTADGGGGGEGSLTGHVDSDGPTIVRSNDRHHDDEDTAREVGGRKSPENFAVKEMNLNIVWPTSSRPQVFESRNRNLSGEGGETVSENHSVLYTSSVTPPQGVFSEQTRSLHYEGNLCTESHPCLSVDTRRQGSEDPEREGIEDPEREGTESPEREGTESPERAGTESPEREGTESPEREDTESPEREGTESPERAGTESPEREGTESPEREGTKSPEREGTESPEREGTESPERAGTESPERAGTESPERAGTESPEREGTEDTPVDFLSLLDNIDLGSTPSISAKTAKRARQIYSSDCTKEQRNSAEIPSSNVNGFEFQHAREEQGSGDFSLNEAEDTKGKTVSASTNSITLFSNDTFKLPAEPTWNETTTDYTAGTSQRENDKLHQDEAEAGKPDELWVSSLPSLELQDREERVEMSATSDETAEPTWNETTTDYTAGTSQQENDKLQEDDAEAGEPDELWVSSLPSLELQDREERVEMSATSDETAEPTWNETTTDYTAGTSQQENDKLQEDDAEAGEPDELWVSSLPSLELQDREERVEMSATSNAKTDIDMSKDATYTTEENTYKAVERPTGAVEDITAGSDGEVRSDITTSDSRQLHCDSRGKPAEIREHTAMQTSEVSHILVTDKTKTESVTTDELIGDESVVHSEADKAEPPQKSRHRVFEMDVVAGNIGVQSLQPVAAISENSVRGEDDHLRFLNPDSEQGGPSKTSSQVLKRSSLELPTSSSAMKERQRQSVPSRRHGKPIIMSATAVRNKADKETSLPRQQVSTSHVNLTKDHSGPSAHVMTGMKEVDRFPSKIATFSSQQTTTADSILEPVSEHKMPDKNYEPETGKSHFKKLETTASATISVPENTYKMNERRTIQSAKDTRPGATRTSSDGSYQTQSSILINHDPDKTREYRALHFSSSAEPGGKVVPQLFDQLRKEGGKEKGVSAHARNTEDREHNTPRDGHLDNRKSSSKVLVLNTSLHTSALQDAASLNGNDSTSLGDNDSQYGSQTSKATSVGDVSPTDEQLYRITQPDPSLSPSFSSALPLTPLPPQQYAVYSSRDRKPRGVVACQRDALNGPRDDDIFSQHYGVTGSEVWRTGRLSVSDPDLSQSLFNRSLSILRPPTTQQREPREAGHTSHRLRSSPSESDEDSGVEGGKRYRSETKLDVSSTERRARCTGSLSNIRLSLPPQSPTSSPREYRVSGVKSRSSWDKAQHGAREQNVYRISQTRTAEDEAKDVERNRGHEALKGPSWSSPKRREENAVQSFKVLHTLPSQRPSLMDDGDFRKKQMTSRQTTPPAASPPFDDSWSDRPLPASPAHRTGSPADVRQQRSIISSDISSDTDSVETHSPRSQYLVTVLKPAAYGETQKEVDTASRERRDDEKLKESAQRGTVRSSRQITPGRSQDVEKSSAQASAPSHSSSDDGSDMESTSKTYRVSTTANLRQHSSLVDSFPDYDTVPDYDNLPAALPDSKRYVVHTASQLSAPTLGQGILKEKNVSMREHDQPVISPPPEPRPLFHDRAWQQRTTTPSDVFAIQNDKHTQSPHQQQSRNSPAFSRLNNIQDGTRDTSDLPPSHQQYFSGNVWPTEQAWRMGSSSPAPPPARSSFSDFHADHQHHYTFDPPRVQHNEVLHHRPLERDLHTTFSSTTDADDDPGAFRREVYEETSFELCQDTTTPVLPEAPASDEEKDLRVLHGKILIQNRLDDSRAEEDFLHNMNIFDTSFHLDKDNPLYQSDPDIYKALEAELRQQEEERRKSQAIGQEVTQDVTWETVERVARRHEEDQSPRPHRPKQNLSTLLLSKLSSIHSQDIRQHIDVKHHHEDIFGDLHLMHADGSRAASSHTSNFDSVHENIELLLKEGKAFVIIKVIAERIVPVDPEFGAWRKSQAIVTRNIEIDLHATEQRRRLYQNVMDSGGRVPGVWQDVADSSAWDDGFGESWPGGREGGGGEGGGREEGLGGAILRSSGGEFEERQLSSLETLRLFSQILGLAEEEEEGWRDGAGGRSGREEGGLQPSSPAPPLPPSASVMDLLY